MIFAKPGFVKELNGKSSMTIASIDSLWNFSFNNGLIFKISSPGFQHSEENLKMYLNFYLSTIPKIYLDWTTKMMELLEYLFQSLNSHSRTNDDKERNELLLYLLF